MIELARHTNSRGLEVHVLSFARPGKESFLQELEASGVPLFVSPSTRFYDPGTLWSILRHLRRHAIDIVHTHMIDADVLGRVASRLAGRPVISTLQNVPQSYDRNRLDRRWLARVTARLLASHSVAVSRHVRDLFVECWRLPRDRMSVIHNAVALEDFLDVEEGTPVGDSGPTVTNIASLTPQKGQHLLLEAMQATLQAHPQARLMFVGEGVLEQQLRDKARRLGIDHKVTFTGVRRDIPQILAHTDVFALSSLWEGLPLAAVEAMAAARPVVLTDVGGNRELVESEEHGLIVPPNDARALAEGLSSLIGDPKRRRLMGRAARERVRQQFSMEVVARQYDELYRQVARG
jgi:glycosyltransferase involved in cell wall biosynthesis